MIGAKETLREKGLSDFIMHDFPGFVNNHGGITAESHISVFRAVGSIVASCKLQDTSFSKRSKGRQQIS